MSVFTVSCLSSNDLRGVFNEVYEARAKWRRIGLELNLTHGTLDAIEKRSPDPADQLERVLIEWLNNGMATWEELVKVLFSIPVGETELARSLEKKYCSESRFIIKFFAIFFKQNHFNRYN